MNSVQFIAELQRLLAPADLWLRWLSLHAYSTHYLAVAALLYWTGFFATGARLACGILLSTLIFGSGRQLFASPRPYYEHPQLFNGLHENPWGMPSGHSQNAVVFWGLTSWAIPSLEYRLLALLMVLMIALSRLYLGLHYPSQVLAGLGIGLLLLLVWIQYESPFLSQLRSLSLIGQLLLVLAISTLPLVACLILHSGLGIGPGGSGLLPYKRLFFYTGLLSGIACSLVLVYAHTNLAELSPSWTLFFTRALPGLISLVLLWPLGFWQPSGIEMPLLLYLIFWLQGAFAGLWSCLLWPLLHQLLCQRL